MNLPIIFVHWGESDYLKYSVSQAKFFNPDSEIILISNLAAGTFKNITEVPIDKYSQGIAELEYVYKHLNSVPEYYVVFWLKRWFSIRNVLYARNYKGPFLYLDSDVLLYCNAGIEFEKFKNYTFTLNGERGPQSSFFSSVSILDKFCDYIIQSYADPEMLNNLRRFYEYHHNNQIEGGVDDMTLLFEFNKTQEVKAGNTAKNINQSVFDGNFNMPEGYEYDQKTQTKKIYWNNDLPYGKHLETNEFLKFNTIHFQGKAKEFVHRFYKGKGLETARFYSGIYYSYTNFKKKIRSWKVSDKA